MKPLALVIISQGLNSSAGFLTADPAGSVFGDQEITLSIISQPIGIVAGTPEYLQFVRNYPLIYGIAANITKQQIALGLVP
jgi:hypothetical protein